MIVFHVTQEGERWDQLAYRFYGNPLAYELIIQANPYVPLYEVLPSGIKLAIPLLEKVQTSTEDLPPWLR